MVGGRWLPERAVTGGEVVHSFLSTLNQQVSRVVTGLQIPQEVHHMSPFDPSHMRYDSRQQLEGRHVDHGQLHMGPTYILPTFSYDATNRSAPCGVDPVQPFLKFGHEGNQRALRVCREWLPRAGVNIREKINMTRGGNRVGRPIII